MMPCLTPQGTSSVFCFTFNFSVGCMCGMCTCVCMGMCTVFMHVLGEARGGIWVSHYLPSFSEIGSLTELEIGCPCPSYPAVSVCIGIVEPCISTPSFLFDFWVSSGLLNKPLTCQPIFPAPSLFSGLLLQPYFLLFHSQTLLCVQLHSVFIAHCFVIS